MLSIFLLIKRIFIVFLIEFIGVTLVHKTTQLSSVQLNSTPSAHCTGCPLPEAKPLSLCLPICLPFARTHVHLPPFSSCCRHAVVCVYMLYIHIYLLLNPLSKCQLGLPQRQQFKKQIIHKRQTYQQLLNLNLADRTQKER